MKWKLEGPWPVGALLIPSGTIIDGENPVSPFGTPLPMPPPLNAQCLDQEAYDFLCLNYPDHLHQLSYAQGIRPRSEAELPMWRSQLANKGD